ncbi:MAG: adenosine deaminase [Opitutales bacterium]|nr:adenosine deaminase [Opitutales bacterium]
MPTEHLSIADFIQRLPKPETHLHIEGALPWELINELEPGRFSSPPASWDKNYRFQSFAAFETELLDMAGAWYQSPERYHIAAKRILSRLKDEQNVRYLETSFASGVVEHFGLDGQQVARAIKQASPPGMEVRVFMGIHHDGYTDRSRGFIEDSIHWPELDGLDLHGAEETPLEDWAFDLWERARANGKFTKAHAGEFMGPEFVLRVVEELGVSRIQHGVRAAEDPDILPRLAAAGVRMDECPISNLKLGVVPSMEAHPIRQLLSAGIPCTISTDDPISFGNTLKDEYMALHESLEFSADELAVLASNGFEQALVDKSLKDTWLQEVRDCLDAYRKGR